MKNAFVVLRLLTVFMGLLLVSMICFETPQSPAVQALPQPDVHQVADARVGRPTMAPPRIPCELRGVGEVVEVNVEVVQSTRQP